LEKEKRTKEVTTEGQTRFMYLLFCLDFGREKPSTDYLMEMGPRGGQQLHWADLGSKETTAGSGMPWFKCLRISS
jgi:hypothetical protein